MHPSLPELTKCPSQDNRTISKLQAPDSVAYPSCNRSQNLEFVRHVPCPPSTRTQETKCALSAAKHNWIPRQSTKTCLKEADYIGQIIWRKGRTCNHFTRFLFKQTVFKPYISLICNEMVQSPLSLPQHR